MPAPNSPFRSSPWWQLLLAVVLLLLLWQVRGAAMLLFGGVVVAAILRALADPMVDRGLLGPRPAVLLVVLVLVLLGALGVWRLGDPLSDQLSALRESVPQAWRALLDWLQTVPLGSRILEAIEEIRDGAVQWGDIAGIATGTLRTFSALLLVLLLGVYLASDVKLYRNGVLHLIRPKRRRRAADALDAAGHALKHWLLGQTITMMLVGLAVTIGLLLLGMPLALALGVIAGLLEFVPYFGPVVAGALAVLVAFMQGPEQALYVALLFIGVQQLEGNILTPLVQRWAVSLPPVLCLMSVVVFGTLFGVAGVVLGTPLMVVVMVLVQRLYVEPVVEA